MKKLIIIAAAFLGISTMASAQTVITDETMTHDRDSVTVTFNIDTEQTKLKTNRKELIFPYIYNEKDTLFLDVVEVYGKGRFKRERQINAINGDRDWGLGENQVFRHDGVYTYESKVPLKRWMKVANLGVRRTIVGCACEDELKDENLAQANLFEEPQVQRRLPAYALGEVERKWDFGQDELEITFKVSKTDIDPTVFNNEVTFKKILEAIDKIHTNPHYKVSKLHVAGYASPEGSQSFNSWLGINRAKALINYIIKQRPEYGLTEKNFEILNGEENWEGLRRVLAESQMAHKDKVIEIIDSKNLSGEAKKRAIKTLDGGEVWNDMLKTIYPHLRSARYLAVFYDQTGDEIAEQIKKANEMVEAGKYHEAFNLLIAHKDDIRTANTIGVSLMLQKKFEEAMPWFEKALQADPQAAQKNIDTLNDEFSWEEQQRKEIEEYLKKYE